MAAMPADQGGAPDVAVDPVRCRHPPRARRSGVRGGRMTATDALRDAPERALRSLFMGLSHRRSLGRLAVRVPITRPMVGRFVAGETLPEVLEALERLRDAGFTTTVDVLGESVASAEECGHEAGR